MATVVVTPLLVEPEPIPEMVKVNVGSMALVWITSQAELMVVVSLVSALMTESRSLADEGQSELKLRFDDRLSSYRVEVVVISELVEVSIRSDPESL